MILHIDQKVVENFICADLHGAFQYSQKCPIGAILEDGIINPLCATKVLTLSGDGHSLEVVLFIMD